MKKKAFSLLLTLAVILSMFPPAALATPAAPDQILIDATEILYRRADGERQAAARYSGGQRATETTPNTYEYTMLDGAYPANGGYYLHLIAYARIGEGMSEIGAAGLEKVSVGLFATAQEMETAENLRDELFTDSSQTGGGYLADFSDGYVDFTMLDILGELHYLRIRTVAAPEDPLPDKISLDATNILYVEKDGTRQAAARYSDSHAQTQSAPRTFDYTMSDSAYPANGSYYLHLIVNAQTGEETSNVGAAGVQRIVEGLSSSLEEFEAAEDIKDALLSDSSQTGGGYLADFSRGYVDFTMMDILSGIHYLRIQTVAAPEAPPPDKISLDATNILYVEKDGTRQAAARYSDSHAQTQSAPRTFDYTMSDSAYPANGSYYLHLIVNAQTGEETSNVGAAGVQRIVEGLSSSLEEFEAAEDIKDALLSDSSQTGGGYLADFSRGYVDFTMMDILSGIHYLRIQTVASPDNDNPASPGFIVNGDFIPLQPSASGNYLVDLRNCLWGDLKSVVPVFPDAQTVRWARQADANQNSFTVADAQHPIDLTSKGVRFDYYAANAQSVTLIFLAGSGTATGQNDRYAVTFYYTDARDLFRFELYRDMESRDNIPQLYTTFYTPEDIPSLPGDAYVITHNAPLNVVDDQYAWLGMRFSQERAGVSVAVYEGLFDSEEAAKAGGTEITERIWNPSDAAHNGYRLPLATSYDTLPSFTFFFKREGKETRTFQFSMGLIKSEDSGRIITVGASALGMLYAGTDAWRDYAAGATKESGYPAFIYGADEREVVGIREKFIMTSPKYPANGQYYVDLYATEDDRPLTLADANGIALIEKAVLGDLRGADFEQAPDIKNQLFSDASQSGGGYLADFGAGSVTFTVLNKDGGYWKVVIETENYSESSEFVLPPRPTPLNLDTFFRVVGTYGPNGVTPSGAYKADYNEDSYYYNGYQTIFLKGMDLKENDVIRPLFYAGPALKIYAGTNAVKTESPVEQTSGVTEATYRGFRPVQYSAASTDGVHLKNYWVTFVTPQKNGPQLFVNGVTNIADEHRYDASRYGDSNGERDNGLPVRELILDSRYMYRHDIILANIGNQPLTGLRAWIVGPDGSEESANVTIDAQYALDGSVSLPSFSDSPAAGWANITQLRIVPKAGALGLIGGYLKISADGQEEITVKLTGVIGDPEIVTETLSDGVKYVHYSSVIQTSNLYDFDPPALEIVDPENFPSWATLKANGEIYGMPMEEGQWTFKVRATFYGDPSKTDEQEYTLTVLTNSTENVWNINDYKRDLTVNNVSVPDGSNAAEYDLTVNENALLVIHTDAEYPEFADKLTVDGVELTQVNKDTPDDQLGENQYKTDEGSTIATIRSQTLRAAANNSTHTISLENRVNKDVDAKMTRTSVNVTVKRTSSGGGSSGGGGGSSGGGSSGGSSSGGGSSSSGSRSSGGSSRTPSNPTYSVSVTAPKNGSLTVTPKSAVAGATVTVTASPNENFVLDSITVMDSLKNEVTLNGSGDTRTFTMPARRVTLSAVFTRVYRVEAYQRDFGWLSASPDNGVRPGTAVTITTHPEDGYRAVNIRAYDGDGAALRVTDNGDGTATFTMPASGVNISADFEPVPPITIIVDMGPADWFYADAEWAFNRGLMNGVTETLWSPQDNISTATAVVTLARLQMGDQMDSILVEFEDEMYARPWLPDGGDAWYWREARWAAASGILTENVFTGREPLSRAGFAVILRNYLRYRGVQVDVPVPYDFSDSELIEARGAALGEDLNSAFQILREADVFRGDRTNAMLPNNNSTRAHMAALLHRLSDYIIKAETAAE